jgi:leucyl-tRNA synthetase
MSDYRPAEIEPKWQKAWAEAEVFKTLDESGREPYYVLDEFPYPSGDGLHVGHVKIYTATDVAARYWRMRGREVLHPTGWDAFGLPTENSAIKFGIHPAELTRRNVDRFRRQMKMMGLSYDWSREIDTSDPAYYRWTQWIFLRLFERGLAYEATVPINWCPSCKTGLANEEVIEGRCARCGHEVVRKPVRQWLLKITEYADRLLAGLDELDWPEYIKDIQRNWIGRSEGAEIEFPISSPAGESQFSIRVFTTRPDTIFGATYVVVAPEHTLLAESAIREQINNWSQVAAYIEEARNKTDLQRQEDEKEKTGVRLEGVEAVNPATGEPIPIFVADYVLMSYGTGAIMAVPAHDERDFDFARRFDLPVRQVIEGGQLPYTGEGQLVNSGQFDGSSSQEAKTAIAREVGGEAKIMYKLRDWVFSRQRYWGEPIPLIHCEKCGVVSVPADELPVELPEVEKYEPTGTGESPLAAIEEWVNVSCPNCGGPARRETNTMPQWAGSSWYWIRFVDPGNRKFLADKDRVREWLPVDIYVGGAEHAVLHLLYGRFWNMVLHDEGIVPDPEPFQRRHIVGLVLAADGQKMSKSRGNVVNPDDEVAAYGADTTRLFAMFMGPFDQTAAWTTAGIAGAHRFLQRVWRLSEKVQAEGERLSEHDELQLHQTVKRVTMGIEQFRFNTAVAALMEMLNTLEKYPVVPGEAWGIFARLLSPFAPHLAEELWFRLGHTEMIARGEWPQADENILAAAAVTIPVQVNGKVRGEVVMGREALQADVEAAARELQNVAKYLAAVEVDSVVYVAGRLINFVVRTS